MPDGVMQEFLTLPATGTKSKIFGNPFPVNSASYKCGQNCKESNPDDSTLTTVYSKIRINPCSFMVDVTGIGKIHTIIHSHYQAEILSVCAHAHIRKRTHFFSSAQTQPSLKLRAKFMTLDITTGKN